MTFTDPGYSQFDFSSSLLQDKEEIFIGPLSKEFSEQTQFSVVR